MKGTAEQCRAGDVFLNFVEIIRRLRHPQSGCPWDKEQTHSSLRPYILEEVYEALEALDRGDDEMLCDELGDLLLQIVLHAQLASERSAFSIEDVIASVSAKMIRRHPHVFGSIKVDSAQDVIRNWESIKFKEREEKLQDGRDNSIPRSALSGVPKAAPALLQAQRLGEKAAKVSFDWTSLTGVKDKVEEERQEFLAELERVVTTVDHPLSPQSLSAEMRQRLEHELGDFFFALCQLARWLGLSAEDCLRTCCERFTVRFHTMEGDCDAPLTNLSEEALEELWQQAKQKIKNQER